MASQFNETVSTRYHMYNSLFLNLPYTGIYRTGTLLPLLQQSCENGYEKGKDPKAIIKKFFSDYTPKASREEQFNLLFGFIQYVERQVVRNRQVVDGPEHGRRRGKPVGRQQLELRDEQRRNVQQGVDLTVRPCVRRSVDHGDGSNHVTVRHHDRCDSVRNAVGSLCVRRITDEGRSSRGHHLPRVAKGQRHFSPDARTPGEADAALHHVPIVVEQRDNGDRRAQ